MGNENGIGYFENLLKRNKTVRRQVTFYMDETKLEELEQLSKAFSDISGDKNGFSRNMLIENAIDKFIQESKEYLQNVHKKNLDEFSQGVPEKSEDTQAEETEAEFDTAVFSTTEQGFHETFLGEKEPACWRPCRIGNKNIPKLKYIAVYRGAPVSGITHYAKVKEIRFDPEKKCKVCYFDGDPIALPHKITFTDVPTAYFHGGTKYTRLDALLNSPQADRSIFVHMS